MRLRDLVFAGAIGALPGLARAEPAQPVVPIPRTSPAEPRSQVPVLDPPPDWGGLEGKPIARVTVVLERNVWNDVKVPPVLRLKVGDPLTPTAARQALEEVLETGRFATGRVSVQPENGGATVVLRLLPRKLIERLDVDLHGARLPRDEVLREADLSDGGELVGADIEEGARRIERYFALHGYPSARASIRTRETDDPVRALVLVDVSAGAPRSIDERHFYVFGAKTDTVLAVADSYGASAGERADEPVLDRADVALEAALHAKGFWHAAVSHDLVWVGNPGSARVALRVRIDAGAFFVPHFAGNDHYDGDVLATALGLEAETDRSPSHLAEKIRAFYQKRGFLDAEVRVEPRGTQGDPVHLVVFHIDEHERVRVVGRSYPCLKLDAVKHLGSGGPSSPSGIGTEIDSYLEEDLPGADLLVNPDPRGVSATVGAGAGQVTTGARPVPIDLSPDDMYVADTYERAIHHVEELYKNEGFLHAVVGPTEVLRARCDPRSPPQRCVPLPLPPMPEAVCGYDPSGLPTPVQPLDPAFTCRPDPSHGVVCAPTVQLVIPVKLGPRTNLWDIAFTGLKSQNERDVADAARAPLGEPVNTTKLEDARRRIVDWYKELGYYYVDVKYELEPSPDSTRARARFDVVEGEQVIVGGITIRGLESTRESVVRRRIAIDVGRPYRASDARKTQERIATLGVFSSITVALSDPYVPQPRKTVIVDVVERPGHYIEVRPGFSTGEGARGTFEYDERNILGYAVGAVFRAQLSYLPDFLILDPQVEANYSTVQDRLARRITLSGTFPDIGLGPLVRSQLDAIYVRDLERDFTLDKVSGVGSLIYRPGRELQVTVGQSVENNNIHLFQFNSLAQYLFHLAMQNNTAIPPGLQAALRVPDGQSLVIAQRVAMAWDRRDASFNAHKGTYVYLGAELVNSVPEGAAVVPNASTVGSLTPAEMQALEPAPQAYSHFVRLTQTFAGYIPLPFINGMTLAAELRLGENVRTAACTGTDPNNPPPAFCTYPDRLFFMGGFDSMRGWLQDTFMPQDYADKIAQTPSLCTSSSTNCFIPIRGGNLMINPRLELRFPIRAPIAAALFADFGNLWADPTYVFNHGLSFRADVGPGVRVDTPVGPLVFDYGINVTRRSYEDFGAFHFAIGLF